MQRKLQSNETIQFRSIAELKRLSTKEDPKKQIVEQKETRYASRSPPKRLKLDRIPIQISERPIELF